MDVSAERKRYELTGEVWCLNHGDYVSPEHFTPFGFCPGPDDRVGGDPGRPSEPPKAKDVPHPYQDNENDKHCLICGKTERAKVHHQ